MPIIRIHSADDPRISTYRDLPDGGKEKGPESFVVEGSHLVDRLLKSDLELVSLFVEPKHTARFDCDSLKDIPIYVAEKRVLQQVVGFRFHRGLLACGRRPASVRWTK